MHTLLRSSERVIVYALALRPHQTVSEIQEVTQITTLKYLKSLLRTLVLAGVIAYDARTLTYSAKEGGVPRPGTLSTEEV